MKAEEEGDKVVCVASQHSAGRAVGAPPARASADEKEDGRRATDGRRDDGGGRKICLKQLKKTR